MKQLPDMQPHTAAKHLLLKRYLEAWFPILGKTHAKLNYIDGFAGPGEYRDGEEGSPVIALRSALAHLDRGTIRPRTEIKFFFIEADAAYHEHLSGKIGQIEVPGSFHICAHHGEFRESIQAILDSLKTGQRLAPTFAFVDPFGFSGIPFELMRSILEQPSCEVFVNVMVDFVNRFAQHPNDRIVAHIPETFGTNKVFEIIRQAGDRAPALLDLYRKQLLTAAKYVGRFDMRNRHHRKLYSLFFASNSPQGFRKMKEATWSVDRQSGQEFSGADTKGFYRSDLFGFEPLRTAIQEEFKNREVPMAMIEQFVIEETDYLPKHAREILKQMEERGTIAVRTTGAYKRRSGTYPVEKALIRFLPQQT